MKARNFVVGDIHGCYHTLRTMLFEVLVIRRKDNVYFLGDYIDRGNYIKETLNFILGLRDDGYKFYCLRGNHEQMALEALKSKVIYANWLAMGGDATLKSLKLKKLEDIDKKYLKFFNSLPYYFELEKFIIVHAHLNFFDHTPFDDTNAMLWSREIKVYPELIGGRKIIGGHTPSSVSKIKESLLTDKIVLDGGCVYKWKKDLGNLCALNLDTMELHVIENIDI